jgi:membrane-bound lytic murein transglycosylase B
VTRTSRVPALVAAGLALSVVIASCGGRADALRESDGSRGAASSPATTTSPQTDCPCPDPSSPLPQPDAWIPRAPDRLARALDVTTRSLRAAIDRWTTESDVSSGRAPFDVQLLALFQQRIYRMLARDPALARDVVARLSTSVAREARINVAAGSDLLSLASPVSRPDLIRTQAPEPPGVLLGFYREAEERFGVAWKVLAAVNYTESKFGRVVSASSAGAQGPMQFIPSTWAAYGLGGDVHDPHDAILGAANYLHASGAPGNYRVALYHYNPVPEYVDAVMRYARQMTRDPRTFYAYYNWQVFVLTKHGDLRLTGPGL